MGQQRTRKLARGFSVQWRRSSAGGEQCRTRFHLWAVEPAGLVGRRTHWTPAASRRADLGAEVRRLRAARGLSLNALAKLVRCSSSHLSEVENGRKLPSVGLIQNLDRALETAG